MTAQAITCGETHLSIEFRDHVDEPEPGDPHIILGNPKFAQWGIRHAATVTARFDGRQRWETQVTAYGYGTSEHTHSEVCLTTGLALMLGPFVICLDAATGTARWDRLCDEAGVFGIHQAPGEDAVVVQTELSILKLSSTGELLWEMGGRDIFTGLFEVNPEGITATDFNGDIYAVRLDTGASAIIGHGAPFPHPEP